MSKTKKFFFAALMACSICSTFTVEAQTDSPYSRYGLGNLRDQATGPGKGMGGVGYGLHTSQSANPLNPASYGQVDSLTFIFDIGVNYNNTSYKENQNKASKSGGGLDYITILFPVSKRLGVSMGVLPFSSAGYTLGNPRTMQDSEGNNVSYFTKHAGSGGLSQVYVGLGYKLPITGLSLGANVSYLFGKLKHENVVTQVVPFEATLPSEYSTVNVTTVKLDFGLQYKLDLKDRSSFTLGAVYTPKINGRGKLVRTQVWPNDIKTPIDQTVATGTPHTLGVGFAYNRKQNLLLAADVTLQRWSKVEFTSLLADNLNAKDRFNDRWKLALGAEYRIAQYSKKYFQKIKFRGGVNYSNSYVNVNTSNKEAITAPKGFDEFGATVGFGLPLRDREDAGGRTSYLNINFEYKYLKPELKGMVSEKFFGVSFNMNINELWFMQRKIN